MPYLIDGHNVIHAHPDLNAEDPHDEAKLVEKLKAFSGRVRKKCTVVFDNGLPGGPSRHLSTGMVEVLFASHNTNADKVIKERIRKHSSPRSLILVSSDHEVQDAARARHAEVMTSQEFVELMFQKMAQDVTDDSGSDVKLSADEVQYWQQLFTGGKPD
jgi:predicted RNA-binding protein with PIN domain